MLCFKQVLFCLIYCRYLDGLQEAGRLTNPRAEKESTGLRAAEELLQKGWIERCHWMDDYRCLVPSTSRETWWYTVVLPEYTCECVAASNGGILFLLICIVLTYISFMKCVHVNTALYIYSIYTQYVYNFIIFIFMLHKNVIVTLFIGLCKHLHIALEAAKQKGLDVDSMQKRLVQELLQRGKTSQCKDMVLVEFFFKCV